MTSRGEKIGQLCWLAYLVTVLPACYYCAGIWVVMVEAFFGGSNGMFAFELGAVIKMIILAALPVIWILGVFLAHRFNGRWLPCVPFLIHLVPMTILTATFGQDAPEPLDQEMGGVFYYLLMTILLLVVGLAAVIVTAIKGGASEGA